MFDKIFLELLNMSYIGSVVILAILFVRMFLKKAPKKYLYLLWTIALLRLILPFSMESVLSIIPINPKPIPVDTNFLPVPKISASLENVGIPMNNSRPVAETITSVNPIHLLITVGIGIWIIGMVLLLAYGICSYIKLKKRLTNAVLEEDYVFRSKNISTPFVIGIIKPKIYLPDFVVESEREYILFHERTHIKRLDHVFRFISYLVLCVHWFNPFAWIAFFISGKDMEMACDESVILVMGNDVKKAYSQSLLNFSTRSIKLSMNPLAFGEGDTKGRIKNILGFKKPKTFFIIIGIIVLVIVFIGLLTNPIKNTLSLSFPGNNYRVEDIIFTSPTYSFTYTLETAPVFSVSSDYHLLTKEQGENPWKDIGGLYEVKLNKDELLSWIHFTEFLDEKAIDIMDKENIIYRADTNNENDLFYLVLETKDHEILIFYGYGTEEEASIRWIFETKPIKSLEISLSSTEMRQYRSEYIGNNSDVASILNQLQFPDYLEYKEISLQTETQPFGITITLAEKEVNTNINIDENAQIIFEINACILFSLVQNLEQVSFSVDGELIKFEPLVYTRNWAYETIGANLWEESSTEASFVELLLLIKETLSESSDASVDVHILSKS